MTAPHIYLITRGEATTSNFVEESENILNIIKIAVEKKISLIQIREKQLTAKQVFGLTRRAAEIVRGSETRLLVNDRFDIALAAGADGVQLTSRSLSPDAVRKHVSTGFLIGVSIHNVEEVNAAGAADFFVFGPVFATPGKEAVGREKLSAVCAATDLPVIAIGGIDETNVRSAIDAGAAGVAAIRSLNDTDSMRKVVEAARR